jgi:PAS domain S-box-containing protein
MLNRSASYVLVMEGESALALFSERDLLLALTELPAGRTPRDTPLRALIGTPPVCVAHDTSMAEASIKMDALHLRHLGVLNDRGQIVGVVSQHHVMERLRPTLPLEDAGRSRERMERERKAAPGNMQALHEAVDQAGDGIATCDLSGHVQFANRAWARMHGYPQDKLTGKHISLFHAADQMRGGGEVDLTQLIRQGSQHAEVGHIRRDGSRFSTLMTTTPLRDADGQLSGYIRVARDTTEARQVHARLETSELRFRRILEAAPLALAYFTAGGEISYRNARFVDLFGYTAQDAPTAREWLQLAFPDPLYRRQVLDKINAAVHEARALGSELPPLECNITSKDGEVRTIEYAGILLEGDTVATIEDVTRCLIVRRFSFAAARPGSSRIIASIVGTRKVMLACVRSASTRNSAASNLGMISEVAPRAMHGRKSSSAVTRSTKRSASLIPSNTIHTRRSLAVSPALDSSRRAKRSARSRNVPAPS